MAATLGSVQLALRIGDDEPGLAPASIMGALRSVEVTQTDTAPCGFQLTFLAELLDDAGGDFGIVASDLLKPFARVLVRVAVDGVAQTLIDGFITHHQYVPSNGPGDSNFVVTGEDVSVKMDLIDYSREFPALPDDLMVGLILLPWTILGIIPDIQPTLTALVPFDHVPQQAGTDRQTIQQLAQANGYVFFVRPGDDLYVNEAYWGPPPRGGTPSVLLDVAVGPASNVDSIQFSYDALAPTTYFGLVMETVIDPYLPIPLLTVESTREPAFAADPALSADSILALTTRKKLWSNPSLDPARAILEAQSMTNASTEAVVTATCEVEVTRLGTVVAAPGVVGVRGTGGDHDGLYYLKAATHRIELQADDRWDYHQSLTLTREGVGTTTTTLEVGT